MVKSSSTDLDDPNQISIDFKGNCLSMQNSESSKIGKCENVKTGDVVKFDTTVKVENIDFCLKKKQTELEIKLQNTNDKLILDVSCVDCEKQCGDLPIATNSTVCTNRGDLICGGCHCRTGYKGQKCECDINNPDSNKDKCKATNGKHNKDGIECSGNGKCKCGKCVCDNEHVGEFCNCFKEDCPKDDSGKICGGASKGECSQCFDGEPSCKCKEDWTNEISPCSCPTETNPISIQNCKNKRSNLMCSGSGDCVCGKCKCHDENSGNFCEKDSDGKFCQGIVPCMKYNLSGSSEDQEECQKETGGFYGQKLHKACKIPKNLNFSDSTYLFVKKEADCENIFELKVDETYNFKKCVEVVDNEKPTLCNMEEEKRQSCGFEVESCKTKIFHYMPDGYFETGKGQDHAFLVYRYISEDDESSRWDYKAFNCSAVPWQALLGTAVGVFLAIVIGVAIALVVMVNLKDLREYKRFVKSREEANRMMSTKVNNPLFQRARKSYHNVRKSIMK